MWNPQKGVELNNGGIAEADQNIEGVDFQLPPVDGDNIFSGLGDLNNSRGFNYCGDFLEILDMSDPMDCQADPLTKFFVGDQ